MIRAFLLFLMLAGPALAATSDTVRGHAVSARLLSVEDGIGPGEATVSAGMHIELDEGWKTYWRSPGEVGLPPEISWEGSDNIASVDLAYPAPTRFDAFDIQNFGYGEEVLFPLTVRLQEPGAPARLALRANLLVCADLCVPDTVELVLDLPQGAGMDEAAAALLSDWIARVPGSAAEAGIELTAVHLDDAAMTVTATSDVPFDAPDIFPEHGDYASFDLPEIVLSDDGRALWARLPVLSPGGGDMQVTLTDGARAATIPVTLSDSAPARPAGAALGETTPGVGLGSILLIALLGGLILNVMPCVLPVLSIKLASALQAADRSRAEVRRGFMASVAGVMVFFLGLAAVLIGLRAAGVAVGWGVQFQSPLFLALMIGLIVVFAANMLGLLSVRLSQGTMTSMARAETGGGWRGDFATGLFAAVMATPCSAPFIGTAVTYALTHGPLDILFIFAAMGAGLALPYLAVGIWPGLLRILPRPGAWMIHVQRALAVLLLLTAVWLLTVLAASAGWVMALVVGALAVAMLAGLALRRKAWAVAGVGLAAVALASVLVPEGARTPPVADTGWEVFSEARLAAAVAEGEVVFVDVTADWCLTCKANKRLVLDGGAVSAALAQTVTLQADWTRPDAAIAAYLASNDRFGIPFNAVYGPGAPGGVVLPELLTEAAVLDAIARAGG